MSPQLETAHITGGQGYLQSIIENLPAAIVVFDAAETLVAYNQSYVEYVRIHVPVMADFLKIGLNLYDYVSEIHKHYEGVETNDPELDAMHASDPEGWIRTRMSWYKRNCETKHRHNNIWIKSIDKYLSDGTYIGVRIDVTDLVEAEEKARAASQAKSAFLANMSHEIRTPMNGVLGMAQVLSGTGLTAEQQDMLAVIQHSGKALLTLINDILDFSKIESGKMELEYLPFSLTDCLEDISVLLGSVAREKGLDLVIECDEALPAAIFGDEGRVRQMCLNIIGNAIKFTQEGYVLIRAGVDNIRGDKVDLVVSVQDTGIGISKDAQARIFDEFAQADTSTTRLYGGTGLGLAITRSLAKKMGGHIAVESAVGQGTTITLHVTAVIDRSASSPVAPARPVTGEVLQGLKCLVIDDLEVNRRVLRGLLAPEGTEIVETASAKDGLKLLVEHYKAGRPFDLLITDYQMPEINGCQLLKALRQSKAFADLKTLALTSVDSGPDIEIFKSDKNCKLNVKPVLKQTLLRDLDALIAPAALQPVSQVQPVAAQPTSTARILVAEDDKTNQTVLTYMLKPFGYQVDVVENGKQALQRYSQNTYDLVLLDIFMPVMDGQVALKHMRELDAGRGRNATPIVAITAHALSGQREAFLEEGFDDYISKPVSQGQLETVLKTYLEASPDQSEVRQQAG